MGCLYVKRTRAKERRQRYASQYHTADSITPIHERVPTANVIDESAVPTDHSNAQTEYIVDEERVRPTFESRDAYTSESEVGIASDSEMEVIRKVVFLHSKKAASKGTTRTDIC